MNTKMKSLMQILSTFAAAALFATGAIGADDTAAKAQAPKHKLVMQVSDPDPMRWNLALNNAENVQEMLGRANVAIEIVAYGPGIGMLKLDSQASLRIDDALKRGVKLVACEVTMTKQRLTKADMLPNIGYAASGVVEMMEKQEQGYSYVRP
jgi:hypothetical protein